MDYKILFTVILLGMTSLLWSQENTPSELERRLVSYAHDLLLKAETSRSLKIVSNCPEVMFQITADSVSKYKILRKGIIEKAFNYIGVSYRYGASSEKAFDCSGFVKFVFRKFGLELPHSSSSQYKLSKHIETNEAQFGDLVFFITRGKGISHVGIYLGNKQFIHSPGRGRTVSIDSLSAGYYKKHLAGFGSVL
jgi:hypothetical protein